MSSTSSVSEISACSSFDGRIRPGLCSLRSPATDCAQRGSLSSLNCNSRTGCFWAWGATTWGCSSYCSLLRPHWLRFLADPPMLDDSMSSSSSLCYLGLGCIWSMMSAALLIYCNMEFSSSYFSFLICSTLVSSIYRLLVCSGSSLSDSLS